MRLLSFWAWGRWALPQVGLHSGWPPGTRTVFITKGSRYESSLEYDLISINDACPTYIPGSGSSPSNIDLIYFPLALSYIAKVDVIADPFGSDHLPVVLELETAVSSVLKPTRRINTGDVSWARFHEYLEADLPKLRGSLGSIVPRLGDRHYMSHLLSMI